MGSGRIEVFRAFQEHPLNLLGTTDPEKLDMGTVLLHELAGHFWQQTCSPYGLHLWRLNHARVSLVGSLLQRLRDEHDYRGPIYIPLRDWCVKAASTPIGQALSSFLQRWDELQHHERHLEGTFLPTSLTIGDAIESWWQVIRTLSIAFNYEFDSERPIGSNYSFDTRLAPPLNDIPIGAHVLSEGFATGVEMDYLFRTSAKHAEFRWNATSATPYKVPWGYLRALAGGDECQEATWVVALADLAFCGPIDIHQIAQTTGPLLWEEIHPGWRFHRALHSAKNLGLLTGPTRVGPGRIFDYESAIGAICDDLNWTPPWKLWKQSRCLNASGLIDQELFPVPVITVPEEEHWTDAETPSTNRRFVLYYYKQGMAIRQQFPDAVVLPMANPFYTGLLLHHLGPFHVWDREKNVMSAIDNFTPLEVLASLGPEDWPAKVAILGGNPGFRAPAPAQESLYLSATLTLLYDMVNKDTLDLRPPESALMDDLLSGWFGISREDVLPLSR